MTRPLIDTNNLASLISECISDLRNGTGSRLYDLGRTIDAIAESNSHDYLHVIPQCIGAFTQEVLASKSLTLIPMLPPHIRDKHTKTVSSAVEGGVKALEEIRRQLCERDTVDFQKLMECSGSLMRYAGNLHSERRFMAPRGGGDMYGEE